MAAEVMSAGVAAPGLRTPGVLAIVDELLRDRSAALARCEHGAELAALARVLLATIVVGAAMFGVALGTYRGGAQLAFAALKVPMALVGTAAVCAPALTAVGRALDRPASLPRDLALLLMALARGALVLLALAPLVLAARAAELDYHRVIILASGCAAVAAIAALTTLLHGVRRRGRRGAATTIAVVAIVFAGVGAQAAWTLRPFVVRPQSPTAPFVRDLDGSLYDALRQSARSAMGIYDPGWPALPVLLPAPASPDEAAP